MDIIEQIYIVFNERNINLSDPLERHFNLINENLLHFSISYGLRHSRLDEENLKDIFQESIEYILKSFKNKNIDLKIKIIDSRPILERFIKTFIFIYKRRMINFIKRLNKCIELTDELLEHYEIKGYEEVNIDGLTNLTAINQKIKKILIREHFSDQEILMMEFYISRLSEQLRLNDFINYYFEQKGKKITKGRVSQIKKALADKLEENRKALNSILMFF